MHSTIPRTTNRRKFLKLAGITLGVSAAACCGLGALATIGPRVDFVEKPYQGEKAMGKRILVAYASKAGSTGEVAQAIGEVLAGRGAAVDVYPVEAAFNIQDYQAVIVGSAARQGSWMRAATRFVEANRPQLSQVPTAYFTCCMTLQEETEEKRREALGYMDPVGSMVTPVAVGAFAGKMDFSKLSFLDRTIIQLMGGSEGDYRPWEAIRAWAGELKMV
jgi:menaquinone-dependent protoporphyrinogen oxidase